jgi:hypothetical protein
MPCTTLIAQRTKASYGITPLFARRLSTNESSVGSTGILAGWPPSLLVGIGLDASAASMIISILPEIRRPDLTRRHHEVQTSSMRARRSSQSSCDLEGVGGAVHCKAQNYIKRSSLPPFPPFLINHNSCNFQVPFPQKLHLPSPRSTKIKMQISQIVALTALFAGCTFAAPAPDADAAKPSKGNQCSATQYPVCCNSLIGGILGNCATLSKSFGRHRQALPQPKIIEPFASHSSTRLTLYCDSRWHQMPEHRRLLRRRERKFPEFLPRGVSFKLCFAEHLPLLFFRASKSASATSTSCNRANSITTPSLSQPTFQSGNRQSMGSRVNRK